MILGQTAANFGDVGRGFPGPRLAGQRPFDCSLPLHMRSAEIESFARVTISKDFEDVYAAIS